MAHKKLSERSLPLGAQLVPGINPGGRQNADTSNPTVKNNSYRRKLKYQIKIGKLSITRFAGFFVFTTNSYFASLRFRGWWVVRILQ